MAPSANGPPRRPATPRFNVSRPVRLAGGAVVAFMLIVGIATPIILGGGESPPRNCAKTLRYDRHLYVAQPMPAPPLVQSLAIGIGVLAGCGTPASNINIRSLAGVPPSVAIGIPSDGNSVYVREHMCPGITGRAFGACLRSHDA
jgi:hypothetical protein